MGFKNVKFNKVKEGTNKGSKKKMGSHKKPKYKKSWLNDD